MAERSFCIARKRISAKRTRFSHIMKMMKRKDILERLDAFPYPSEDWWVITGAAMVLYGMRETTHDIDICCSKAMADRLEREGIPPTSAENGKRSFRIGEDIEIFEDWFTGPLSRIGGYNVLSPEGLIEMKRQLNRPKDIADIRLIRQWQEEHRKEEETENE